MSGIKQTKKEPGGVVHLTVPPVKEGFFITDIVTLTHSDRITYLRIGHREGTDNVYVERHNYTINVGENYLTKNVIGSKTLHSGWYILKLNFGDEPSLKKRYIKFFEHLSRTEPGFHEAMHMILDGFIKIRPNSSSRTNS
jgi:hypothetical protein